MQYYVLKDKLADNPTSSLFLPPFLLSLFLLPSLFPYCSSKMCTFDPSFSVCWNKEEVSSKMSFFKNKIHSLICLTSPSSGIKSQ